MKIDGTQLARALEAQLLNARNSDGSTYCLALVVVGDDPVVERFVRIKERFGERIGVHVRVIRLARDQDQSAVGDAVTALVNDPDVHGVVVQLPLPEHLNTDEIINKIPMEKDVDALSRAAVAAFACGDAPVLPPVAGAVQLILEHAGISIGGAEVLVLGHGRLVGVPVSILLRHNGAHVTVIDRPIADLATHVRESRVIISGVGKASLITPDMVTPGSILIDAGSSEAAGKTVGDMDPKCAEIAGYFTPVPGGVGPLTVAMLFKNLLILARARHSAESVE